MEINEIITDYFIRLNRNPLWKVLRWITVLPVPLFIIFIIHLIIHAPLFFLSSPDVHGERMLFSSIPIQLLENLAAAFYAPFFLLSIGTALAPKFKLRTAQVLICLWGIVFIFSIIQFLISYSSSVWEWVTFGMTLVLGIFGALAGYSEAQKQHTEAVDARPQASTADDKDQSSSNTKN